MPTFPYVQQPSLQLGMVLAAAKFLYIVREEIWITWKHEVAAGVPIQDFT